MYMNHYQSLSFISFILLISLVGISAAEVLPAKVIFIQGGEGNVTDGIDGMKIVTVKDISPFFNISDTNSTVSHPIKLIPEYSCPMNGAVEFSNNSGESGAYMIISNLSLSSDEKIITIEAVPVEFYEGEALKFAVKENKILNSDDSLPGTNTSLYFEVISSPPSNSVYMFQKCRMCLNTCKVTGPEDCDKYCYFDCTEELI